MMDDDGQSEQRLPRGDEDLEKAGIRIGSLGDAGETLGDQAKAAYRRRPTWTPFTPRSNSSTIPRCAACR
jgi:hypothetical protein